MRRTSQLLLTMLALVLVFAGVLAHAQTSRGTVTGVVTDSSGAVVSKATVSLTEKSKTEVRTTQTNESGIYRFDAVNLGDYSISVSAPGFANSAATAVSVQANRSVALDFQLKPGSAAETVTVEGTAPEVLQTTEQLRGKSIESRELADLPIGGQNSLNLILTAPGVIKSDLGGSLNSGIGSVNGARPRSNNFMIDGVGNNDISVAGPSFTLTNNDAIQEVSIQTSNFSSEYGRAGGAVINQITKSGTNSLHGTGAFVYLSEDLNAANRDERNAFSATSGKPLKSTFHEIIPAFTVGGPLYIPHVYDGRNRTFWFVSGQWDRLPSAGIVNTFQVPTAAGVAVLQGLSAQCPAAKQYLTALDGLVAPTTSGTLDLSIPAATFAATGLCTGNNRAGVLLPFGNAGRAVGSLQTSNNYLIRFDHRISDKQQLSVRWLDSKFFQNNATVAISKFYDADTTDRELNLSINHSYVISNNMTNEFRVSYARLSPNFPLSNPAAATGPQITFSSAGSLSGFGASATFPQGRTANTFEYQDTIALVKGKHSMRFGADYLRQLAAQFAPFNSRGTITYTGTTGIEPFSNFLDDFSGDTGTTARLFGSNLYRPNLFSQAYFFMDSWRITPDFTFNAGLRYENFGQPANIFTLPAVTLDPTQFGVPSHINQDNNNFGPSLGFAWNPHGILRPLTGDGKLVVRGGFQTTYDSFFNNLLSNMAAANPNNPTNIPVVPSVTPATPRGIAGLASTRFPNLAPAPLNPATNAGSQFDTNIRNPYTNRWSLGIQREMPSKVVLDISYVGSASFKQFINRELNPLLPNASFTAASTTRLISGVGSRTPRISEGNANYNALQIEGRRQYSDTPLGGVLFTAAYTWSKAMDNTASEAFTTNNAPTSFASARLFGLSNTGLDYGPADFDHTHRFVSTIVWDVRGPKGNGFAGQTLGGWSLSFVVPIQTGEPFTVQNGRDRDFDGSSTGDRPDIGNPNAPENTRAKIVPVGTVVRTALNSACPTGYVNPDVGSIGTCVNPTDVRFVQVAGYSLPGANTAHRNYLRTPGSWLVDMNVIKKFSITERTKLEYRAEIFNLANHENFDYTPFNNVNVNSAAKFLDYTGGRPSGSLLSNSRTMRMGLKVIF